MQTADREEFKLELGKLCAGFDVPCTKLREEAYWTAFTRLSIGQFRRCVEFALSADYDGEEFPKTGQIWKIHTGASPKSALAAQAPSEDPDHLAYFANRLLWMHISHRGGLGSTGRFVPGYGMVDCQASAELDRVLEFKRELVTEFCRYITERDDAATPAAFVRWWLAGLSKISEVLPRTKRDLERVTEEPESEVPFDVSMARALPDTSQRVLA